MVDVITEVSPGRRKYKANTVHTSGFFITRGACTYHTLWSKWKRPGFRLECLPILALGSSCSSITLSMASPVMCAAGLGQGPPSTV